MKLRKAWAGDERTAKRRIAWEVVSRYKRLDSSLRRAFSLVRDLGAASFRMTYFCCLRDHVEMGGYIYILGNRNHVLYVGVTNDLSRRVSEHKSHLVPGFTRRYNVDRLLYHEAFPEIAQAIAREKVIKGWTRAKKLALIATMNPEMQDLAVLEGG